MQVRSRTLRVNVFVLACPTLGGKDRTGVDFLEVAIRKLVSFSGTFILLVVDSQVPLPVFRVPVRVDELVFLSGGRPFFAPRVSFVPADTILWVHNRDAELASALLADAERQASRK
jgi:hypothetical protein